MSENYNNLNQDFLVSFTNHLIDTGNSCISVDLENALLKACDKALDDTEISCDMLAENLFKDTENSNLIGLLETHILTTYEMAFDEVALNSNLKDEQKKLIQLFQLLSDNNVIADSVYGDFKEFVSVFADDIKAGILFYDDFDAFNLYAIEEKIGYDGFGDYLNEIIVYSQESGLGVVNFSDTDIEKYNDKYNDLSDKVYRLDYFLGKLREDQVFDKDGTDKNFDIFLNNMVGLELYDLSEYSLEDVFQLNLKHLNNFSDNILFFNDKTLCHYAEMLDENGLDMVVNGLENAQNNTLDALKDKLEKAKKSLESVSVNSQPKIKR